MTSINNRCNLSFHGHHSQTKKNQQYPKQAVYGLLESFYKLADYQVIQCVNEKKPETRAYQDHDKNQH